MPSKEINDSLDSYLAGVRSRSPYQFPIRSTEKKHGYSSKEEYVPHNIKASHVYVIRQPRSLWQRLKDAFGTEEEENFVVNSEKTPVKQITPIGVTTAPVKDATAYEQEYNELSSEQKKSSWWRKLFWFVDNSVNEASQDVDTAQIPQHSKTETSKVIISEQKNEKKVEPMVHEQQPAQQQKSKFKRFIDFLLGEDDTESVETPTSQPVETPISVPVDSAKVQELTTDLKEIAKISAHAFKLLPKEDLKEFKQSKEFAHFKEILSKHKLLK